MPSDSVEFVHVEVFSPSRRLVNWLKRLGVTRRRESGVWRVDGEWDRPPGQLVSERAPPCDAAVSVLNRILGDEGNFALYEVLD